MRRTLDSWGRYPRVSQDVLYAHNREAPVPAVSGTLLPRGNGRSYGDSCLNPGGTLLATRDLDRFIAFDPATGILQCEPGVTLDAVLAIAVPQGWFLPVTPGTRYVSIGGALANDVHGKNHHRVGTFGDHVLDFEIARSDGTRVYCSPGAQPDLFRATIGGLGLTGLVQSVRLQLRRIAGPWLQSETIRFGSLDEFFAISRESTTTHEYAVAWIDCLAGGRDLGRGHFIRADHAAEAGSPPRTRTRAIPFTPPFSLVNRLSLRAFNTVYYHRQLRRRSSASVHYQSYFYPLDGIRDWNRIYGPKGFLQHQSVLPPGAAREGLAAMLRTIAAHGAGSFLAVLKEFGDLPPAGMLSFARPGTTLALDFPNTGPAVFELLDRLDAIVREAGGALYPAKDARMAPITFQKSFPRWREFADHVDPKFSSGFWHRVTGTQ